VDALADRARVEARPRLAGEQVVEALLLLDGAGERRGLRFVDRQLRDLVGELAEAAVHARVVAREPRIVHQRELLRGALDRGDAIDQRAAGARRLRGGEHRGPALRDETL